MSFLSRWPSARRTRALAASSSRVTRSPPTSMPSPAGRWHEGSISTTSTSLGPRSKTSTCRSPDPIPLLKPEELTDDPDPDPSLPRLAAAQQRGVARRRRRRRDPAPANIIAGSRSRAARRTAAGAGPLALLAHQVRFDLLASFRNPRARFFTIIFPIVLLVILAGVFGHGTTVVDGVHVKLSHFYVPGILAMSIITSAYATLVVSVATARETGVLKRRRATPVSPAILIGGQALATLATTAIMTAVLLLIGRFALRRFRWPRARSSRSRAP